MQELRVTISGNVVADPELRIGSTGNPFTTFRVAVNITKRTDAGVYQEVRTEYYRVTAFGALGHNAMGSLKKGQGVLVYGRFKTETYPRQDGSEGASIEITADALGHDLTFGWADYHKGRKPAEDSSDPRNDPAVRAARQEDYARDQHARDQQRSGWGSGAHNWNSDYVTTDAGTVDPGTGELSSGADGYAADSGTGEAAAPVDLGEGFPPDLDEAEEDLESADDKALV